MTLDLWLCLFSFVVVLFPYLFSLKKFKRERANPFGQESFQAFQFFDIVWTIFCVGGFVWRLFTADGNSHKFALLAMLVALITIPVALYSSLTGIYPERSRIGYYYFQQYNEPAKQFLMLSKYPELKTVGWVQLILLISIVGVSASQVFW